MITNASADFTFPTDGGLPRSSTADMLNAVMRYLPSPIDTRAITLPPDLAALTERLAENTHDIWSAQRIKDGWRWGPQRDDQKKLHPCLVPYADLPEAEKEYDRVAALGTLRAILALGYEIKSPSKS